MSDDVAGANAGNEMQREEVGDYELRIAPDDGFLELAYVGAGEDDYLCAGGDRLGFLEALENVGRGDGHQEVPVDKKAEIIAALDKFPGFETPPADEASALSTDEGGE